jgi:two-component system, OmpR family, response regulator QseB
MSHILIIEDEPRIVSFLEKGLRSNGFTITIVRNGKEAVAIALNGSFDLMLLDLGLPGKDGLIVLEELRGQGIQTPIIILTARFDVDDKVIGLEAGADDYVTKPFRFEELLARIRARLRSVSLYNSSPQMMLTHGDIVLDLHARQLRLANQPIELSSREFALMELFLRHPGQVISRQQVLDRIWGYDYDPGSNIVDVYVGYLRKKLGNHLIETIRRSGYRLRV